MGRHAYTTRTEAVLRAWQAASPESYAAALARHPESRRARKAAWDPWAAQRAHGVEHESEGLRAFERETGKRLIPGANLTLHFREVPVGGGRPPFLLCGRLDGVVEGTGEVVELKNRMTRMYPAVAAYEAIQVQTYLHIVDRPDALHVQHRAGEILVTPIRRDRTLWDAEIQPALEWLAAVLEPLLRDPEAQDRMLEQMEFPL